MRLIWAAWLLSLFLFAALAVALLILLAKIDSIDSQLRNGTTPGLENRAVACLALHDAGRALPAVCRDPAVERFER